MEYDNNVIEYYQTYLTIKLLNPDVRILLLLSTVREVADEPLKSLYPENGVIGVLKKPFDMGEVVAYIEEFIVEKQQLFIALFIGYKEVTGSIVKIAMLPVFG